MSSTPIFVKSSMAAKCRKHLLLTVLVMCCLTLQGGRGYATEPDAQLRVATAFRPVTLRGYTRAETTTTIAAEVAGQVTAVNYDIGELIGTTALLNIDDTFITLDLANNAVALASNEVAQQQAQLRLDWLEKEFQRRAQLIQQQRISQVAFEEIAQQRDQAKLELEQQQLHQQQLQVQRQVLNQQLQRHTPTAPAGWQVSQRYVEPGDLVQVGKPLLQVGNYQQLLIPLAVTPEELAAIRRTADSIAKLAGRVVTYHLATISPAFDETTRKINIEIAVDNYNGEKRGGLSFELAIKLADSGLIVPLAAVRNRYQHPQVQPINSQQPVTIEIIDYITGNAETTASAGELVHIQATDKLPVGTLLKANGEN